MKISCKVRDEETNSTGTVDLEMDVFLAAMEAIRERVRGQLAEIVKQQKEILGKNLYNQYQVWHVHEGYELQTIEANGELTLFYEEPWQYEDKHHHYTTLQAVLDGSFVTNCVNDAQKYKDGLELQEKMRLESLERAERAKLTELLGKYGAP